MPIFQSVEGRHLEKRYGSTAAFSNLSFRFEAGQVTLIEGANGVGKSSLLRVLALLTRADQGSLFFDAFDTRKEAWWLRRHIGFLAHEPMLNADLSGIDNLRYTLRFAGIDDLQASIEEAKTRCDLGPWLERKARTYSRGQLQRLSLACALCKKPMLLLLDEPTASLDSSSSAHFLAVAHEEAKRGAVVVLVSHDTHFNRDLRAQRFLFQQGQLVHIS